jgi:hypothetical protein
MGEGRRGESLGFERAAFFRRQGGDLGPVFALILGVARLLLS